MPRNVDLFLAHYASKYYDPVKAREYYLRTRELKGNQPNLSTESRERQREATAYVSNEIANKKKAELAANANARDQISLAAKARAEAHSARMKKLAEDATQARKKVVEKFKAKIEKLENELKIPENANPKLRAFLEKQRKIKLGKVGESAKTVLAELQNKFRASVDTARDEYRASREDTSKALRGNSEQRRAINDNYRAELATEKQNIKDQVR